ncbi:MAG: EMI1 family protein [Desulfobacterales bacterium]|nr:EMI1 family protein [Desulfobacterales bacterium]
MSKTGRRKWKNRHIVLEGSQDKLWIDENLVLAIEGNVVKIKDISDGKIEYTYYPFGNWCFSTEREAEEAIQKRYREKFEENKRKREQSSEVKEHRE